MNPTTDALTTGVTAESGLHARAEMLLLPGLLLGIAGDYLLRNGPVGPGLFVWLALLTAAALWLTRAAGPARLKTLATWSAVALVAAAMTILRDLELVIPAMLLVILICAVQTSLETGGMAPRAARIRDYFATGFSFPLHVLTLTPRVLKQADLSSVTRNQRLPGVVRGVLFAVPLLLVFGALFASADAGFSRYAATLTKVFSPELPQHLLLALVFSWLGTSLLGVACRRASAAAAGAPVAPITLGPVETHVVLALVTALFAVFVVLQLGYLFGGSDVIVSTSGLTVAEYARRGFFELLVVVALTLGLLLALSATDCERHVLRRYGTALVVCVLVILASALQRLFLYTDAFGMTIDRFSALAVMLWQAFNVISFAFTVLRDRIAGFASALVISGITSLLLLALANPAALVAKINLERALEDGRPLDVGYLMFLRADAVPVILDKLAALPVKQQCEIARGLLFTYATAAEGSPSDTDWRRWNAGRSAALRAVDLQRERLAAVAGPGPYFMRPDLPPC